jgi:hypothetical protein
MNENNKNNIERYCLLAHVITKENIVKIVSIDLKVALF